MKSNIPDISLKKVRVHNLKSVDLTLKPNQLIVFTGVSGSGKSSLAFDTIYAEGQRRYVESLSTFARRQLGEGSKPDVEHVSGLSPTISIEQKTAGRNPRSTVGTITEIYDYLRVIYARIGIPHCPVSGEAVTPQSRERIIKIIQTLPAQTKLIVLAPYARGKKAEFREDFQELLRKGFMRARVDGQIIDLNEEIALDGSVAHDVDIVIDRIIVKPSEQSRIAEAVTQSLEIGDGIAIALDATTKEETLFSMHAYSEKSGLSYGPLEPHDFSFNSPLGMCPRCNGLGRIRDYDLKKVIDPDLSIAEDCCSIASSYKTVRYSNIYNNLAKIYKFNIDTPWKELPKNAQRIFLQGTKKKWTRMRFVHPVTGHTWTDHIRWEGVLKEAHRRYSEAKSDHYRRHKESLMHEQECSECHGERLKPYPAATRLGNKRISELSSMTIAEILQFFKNLILTPSERLIAEDLLKEINQRLLFLIDVGLHYLTLNRTAPTLSGGEAQRVRLASQIGCGLVGVTYILDEPSIGLHPRDNKKLLKSLKHLRDMGNTVIVVEHDEETMWEADHIVDFGPGAGSEGGHIIVDGDLHDLLNSERSITGAYLSGKRTITIPQKRRIPSGKTLKVQGACHHNLKNVDLSIPLGIFIAVTGVSGSGKSSLITDILYPALANKLHRADHSVGEHDHIENLKNIDKVIAIDQSPIGKNPRSNPATYIKLFDEIRDLFSKLPESCARGYKPGRFSFNVREGSCHNCKGMGMVRVDMDFLEDQWVDCPLCQTKRFDHETLSVFFKGKNIYDILEMTVTEALEFFCNQPSIYRKLETLDKVGMSYIKIGQSSTTLSGGEAQRVKLAKELTRPASGNTLYILDEPTTGLHFHDIQHLLDVLHELVERGNTVLVIEHNMDVIKTADWIIDLGPEGGEEGGKIIATGTPEQISKKKSATGIAIKEILKKKKKTTSKKKPKAPTSKKAIGDLHISEAQQNNLKRVNVSIPRGKLTICTGPSGSGKSSLAFDTIYAEGQRRYIESLSPYVRQFTKQMPKPKVGEVSGLSPAIAIEQKAHAGNPRSTVGTMTEIYDFLRILYARIGIPHCPETGERIRAISKDHVVDRVMNYPQSEKIQVLAPIPIRRQDDFHQVIERLRRQGFLRIRLNEEFYELDTEEKIPFDRRRKNELLLVIDRLQINPNIRNRLFEAIETATERSQGKVIIMRKNGDTPFNLAFSVESTGKSYPEITPHTFSFNTPEGMCPDCQGLGFQYGANLTRFAEVMQLTCKQFLEQLWPAQDLSVLKQFFKANHISPNVRLFDLPIDKLQLLMNGSPDDQWFKTSQGVQLRWIGINNVFAKAGRSAYNAIRSAIVPFLDEVECISCQGTRVNPLARHVMIKKTSIGALCNKPISDIKTFLTKLKIEQKEKKLLEEVLKQLKNRLQFLCDVGLGYLALDRRAPTLSGGEAQRIRLARQLGSGLTGILYVLDEPSIGLHPHDNARLNTTLNKLKNLGNTLLMVEHDPLTVNTADYLLDFGPSAGDQGGLITARGTLPQIKRNSKSLTGAYLSGKRTIPIPEKRRKSTGEAITIENANLHNLKNISVNIPTEVITCITGVSGSGKSTLINDLLLPAVTRNIGNKDTISYKGTKISGLSKFTRVLSINQQPIGTTARANVGTYTDILPRLRDFFAALPLARTKGLKPGNFSYNHRRGMCSKCSGMGYRLVEMHFLPPVRITCEECHGLRLNPVSLEVRYLDKNFGQFLSITIDEAKNLLANHPRITRILDTLISVGLGYLKLGQEIATLSGGEAQRLKLSRELSKRSRGSALYLLDEPTTGLHADDIEKLLAVLHRLVDKKHTIVIIEHNLDIIKNADHIIDLGPDAGEKGGEIVVTGTPEEVIKHKRSHTAKYLHKRTKGLPRT